MPNDAATTRVLVWDDLDMHVTLASVLVDEPGELPDIDLEAVFLWLDGRCEGEEAPDAYLFTTVEPGREADDVERITDIRTKGFGAVVRRGRSGEGSVELTELLRRHVDTTLTSGSVVELIVASHDGERLAARLQDIAGGPVTVTVLGFRERALFAAENPRLRFVDLEEVPDVFEQPLPRTNLYDLTDEGRVLPALRRPRGASARRTRHAPDWTSWPRPTAPPTASTPAAVVASPAPARPSSPTGTPVAPSGADQAAPPAPPPPPALGAPGGASELDLREPTPAVGLSPAPAAPDAPEPASAATDAARDDRVAPPPAAVGGSLDDLLAGVQASRLAPPVPPAPPRPGRVSPPNGSVDPPSDEAQDS